MKIPFALPKGLSLLLILSLILPASPSYALRVSGADDPRGPVRAGLEAAFTAVPSSPALFSGMEEKLASLPSFYRPNSYELFLRPLHGRIVDPALSKFSRRLDSSVQTLRQVPRRFVLPGSPPDTFLSIRMVRDRQIRVGVSGDLGLLFPVYFPVYPGKQPLLFLVGQSNLEPKIGVEEFLEVLDDPRDNYRLGINFNFYEAGKRWIEVLANVDLREIEADCSEEVRQAIREVLELSVLDTAFQVRLAEKRRGKQKGKEGIKVAGPHREGPTLLWVSRDSLSSPEKARLAVKKLLLSAVPIFDPRTEEFSGQMEAALNFLHQDILVQAYPGYTVSPGLPQTPRELYQEMKRLENHESYSVAARLILGLLNNWVDRVSPASPDAAPPQAGAEERHPRNWKEGDIVRGRKSRLFYKVERSSSSGLEKGWKLLGLEPGVSTRVVNYSQANKEFVFVHTKAQGTLIGKLRKELKKQKGGGSVQETAVRILGQAVDLLPDPEADDLAQKALILLADLALKGEEMPLSVIESLDFWFRQRISPHWSYADAVRTAAGVRVLWREVETLVGEWYRQARTYSDEQADDFVFALVQAYQFGCPWAEEALIHVLTVTTNASSYYPRFFVSDPPLNRPSPAMEVIRALSGNQPEEIPSAAVQQAVIGLLQQQERLDLDERREAWNLLLRWAINGGIPALDRVQSGVREGIAAMDPAFLAAALPERYFDANDGHVHDHLLEMTVPPLEVVEQAFNGDLLGAREILAQQGYPHRIVFFFVPLGPWNDSERWVFAHCGYLESCYGGVDYRYVDPLGPMWFRPEVRRLAEFKPETFYHNGKELFLERQPPEIAGPILADFLEDKSVEVSRIDAVSNWYLGNEGGEVPLIFEWTRRADLPGELIEGYQEPQEDRLSSIVRRLFDAHPDALKFLVRVSPYRLTYPAGVDRQGIVLLFRPYYEGDKPIFLGLPEHYLDYLQFVRTVLGLRQAPQPGNAGAEERDVRVGRALSFLGRQRDILPLLADSAGSESVLTDLSGYFAGAEEIDGLGQVGIRSLLLTAGPAVSNSARIASPLKLYVEQEYRAGVEEGLRGSAIELTNNPEEADFAAGSEEFVQANKNLFPKAVFLQIDESTAALLTERFLVLILLQKQQGNLQPGAVLILGMQVGKDSLVFFQYV